MLHGAGVDTVEFPDGSAMRKAVEARPPALVFHNISLESADAIESVDCARQDAISRRQSS